MNWFAIMIVGIWMGAGIGTAFSKDSQCIGAALAATIVAGIGYFILRL